MMLDQRARAFAKAHPKHDGGTWRLWCGALMRQMCDEYGVAPNPRPTSAKLAGDVAGTLNKDATKAPAGAFHYWVWWPDGHVGLDTTGGGQNVFMASKDLRESLGDCIGFQSVVGYSRNGLFPYRGWSMFYGKNGKITLEASVITPKPPEVVVTAYELEKIRSCGRLQKAGVLSSATPDIKPVPKDELAVILCRFADALAKGVKI